MMPMEDPALVARLIDDAMADADARADHFT